MEYTCSHSDKMIYFLFHLVICASLAASEFQLLHDQRVPPWTTYYSSDLQDCSKDGLLRNFPEIYEIKNESDITIGPPHDFVVTPFEREAMELGGLKNFFYPGAQISFFPPENGTENITGYEIRLFMNRGLVCIIMDFTNRNWHSERQIELELFPLFGLTHYKLSIASLPIYDGNQRTNLTDLVTGVFGSYRIKDSVLPPSANWYASVAYDVIDEDIFSTTRSLEVVFSQPPPDYNFQSFEIILVPKGGNSDIRRAKTSNLYFVFEGVPPGNYRIMMWPVDAYFSQTGRCLCRLADGACSNCVSTVVDTVIIT